VNTEERDIAQPITRAFTQKVFSRLEINKHEYVKQIYSELCSFRDVSMRTG